MKKNAKVIPVLLASVVTFGSCLAFGSCSKVVDKITIKETENSFVSVVPTTEERTDNKISFDVEENNNVAIAMAAIADTDYEKYNVSPEVESAYLLTAKSNPEGLDIDVDWSFSWNSSTFDAFPVSDYIMLTETDEKENSIVVNMLKRAPAHVAVVANIVGTEYKAKCVVKFDGVIEHVYLSLGNVLGGGDYCFIGDTRANPSDNFIVNMPFETGVSTVIKSVNNNLYWVGTQQSTGNFKGFGRLSSAVIPKVYLKCSSSFIENLKIKGFLDVAENWELWYSDYMYYSNAWMQSNASSNKNVSSYAGFYNVLANGLEGENYVFTDKLSLFNEAAALTEGYHYEIKVSVPNSSGGFTDFISRVTFSETSMLKGLELSDSEIIL